MPKPALLQERSGWCDKLWKGCQRHQAMEGTARLTQDRLILVEVCNGTTVIAVVRVALVEVHLRLVTPAAPDLCA